MVLAITLLLAALVAVAATGRYTLPGARNDGALARRPDWTDEQYRRASDEYAKDQERTRRTLIQAGLWTLLAGLIVWALIQISL